MKYGFVFPGGGADTPQGQAKTALEFGIAAEKAGWDAYFMWEGVWNLDPWIALTSVAMRTERIRLGTLLTPASRRRPWKLAAEIATLDQLSDGRAILSVGLGAIDTGFDNFGEETDKRLRAELLDEAIDIIAGLWAGQPFNYSGKHYRVKETTFLPPDPPVQKPRIPIWCVGVWPRMKSMQRVLRCDGLLPAYKAKSGPVTDINPDHLREMKAYVDENRSLISPFDIIMEGTTPGDDPTAALAKVQPWQEAGATWWIESPWDLGDLEKVMERLKQGPPRESR
ncbi:MAG: LLM class flavin-dependent oxidoreductase [Chloroflexota bacterium]